MEKSTLISIAVFCRTHNLESELILSLHEFGLIPVFYEEQEAYIALDDLANLERIISFHNDLEINKEGIEVILRLLEQIDGRLAEINMLKNKLSLYETNS